MLARPSRLSPGLRRFLRGAVVAGLAAGVVSTAVQVVLWLVFTDAFPAILWRDTRLAAAIVMGPGGLAPSREVDWVVFGAATVVHFALSLVYGAAILAATQRFAWPAAAGAGALLGVALYVVNMYGFTLWLPWFAAARDSITLAAHVAFGMTAATACRLIRRGAAC